MATDGKTARPKSMRKPQRQASTSELLERQPPFNLEAEVNVLGSMVLMPDVCDDVIQILRGEDFYDEANRVLYTHLVEMHNSNHRIDIALLRDRLIKSNDYDVVGGAANLAHIFNAVPNAAHATYYAGIVREKSTYRNLIHACTDILQNSYESQLDPEQSLSEAEQKIFAIRESRMSNEISSIETVLHAAMDRLDARMRGEQSEGTVDSGFTDLDRLTGGLHASELVILAARPSMGKTAFAMNIAENVVLLNQVPVLFVSLEMAAIELIERLLCSVARVNGHRLRNGTISQDDRKRLVQHAAKLSRAPLFLDDSPTRTVSEIAAAARRIKRREERLGLIVVDYLQLIQPDNPSDPRQEQVAKIARRLKGLSRELSVPVLCLSQLNRQAEDSREHIPRLSHLRESGAIEQDADVVMFVHREEYFLRGEDKAAVEGEAQIIVAKQRNGPTDKVELSWLKDFTRFEDRAPDRHDELDYGENVF